MFNLEEQEQVETLKAWWKRYGMAVSLAVVVSAAAVSGVQGWRYYQRNQAYQASALYDVLQNAAQSGTTEDIREVAGQLMEKYPRTPYAARAALISAKANFAAGNVKSAKAQLQWTMDHAGEAALRDVSRLQLAAILLDEKHYDAALGLLNAKHGAAYAALYDDLKGDVRVAQGKVDQARAAYRAALRKMDPKAPSRGLIQMKLDALGEGK